MKINFNKRVLAVLLSALMLLSMIPVNGLVAGGDTLSACVEDVTVDSASKTVEVRVMLENNIGITSMGFGVAFDQAAFSYKGMKNGTVFANNEMVVSDKGDGQLFVSAYNGLADKTANGELVVLTFELKGNIDAGDYPVTLVRDDMLGGVFNAIGEEFAYKLISGTITVTKSENPEDNTAEEESTVEEDSTTEEDSSTDDDKVEGDLFTIYAEDVSVETNDGKVNVAIKFANNPGVISLGFGVLFDASVMSYKNATTGTIFAPSEIMLGTTDVANGSLFISANSGLFDKTENGTLITLTFALKSGIEGGDYSVTLFKDDEVGNVYNSNEDVIEYEVVAGTVSVTVSEFPTEDNTEDETTSEEDSSNNEDVPIEGEIIIFAEDVTVDKNDGSFDVQIFLENNPGITSLGFGVKFDPSAITYKGATVGTIFTKSEVTIGDSSVDKGSLFISANNAIVDKTGDGVLVTFSFDVNADAVPGEYEITLVRDDTKGGAFNTAYDELPYVLESGKLIVEAKVYDIVFVRYDGMIMENSKYPHKSTVTLPEALDVPGKIFLGWSSGVEGAELITDDFIALGDLTLTATYEDIIYTVKFYGANGNVVSSDTYTYGQIFTLARGEAISGKLFDGWTCEDVDGVLTEGFAVREDISLTAVYVDRLVGDIDADKDVDMIDALYLARHLGGWRGYTSIDDKIYAADIDRDGDVDVKDYIYLSRHLADWTSFATLPYKK